MHFCFLYTLTPESPDIVVFLVGSFQHKPVCDYNHIMVIFLVYRLRTKKAAGHPGTINAITEVADKMAKGEIEIKVETDSEDELGRLADDITEATDNRTVWNPPFYDRQNRLYSEVYF